MAAGWRESRWLAVVELGLLYLVTRRNVLVPIVSHGVSNSLAFVLIYLGRYPGLVP